jgi:hypothetical protein
VLVLKALTIRGSSDAGDVGGRIEFAPRLNVITAPNNYGKSLVSCGIAWYLGLETMFGMRAGDPGFFPEAARERMDLGEVRGVRLIRAEAVLEVELKGVGTATITREIAENALLQIAGDIGGMRQATLKVGQGSMADEVAGFHSWLFGWSGLPRRKLARFHGGEAPIYFENLAPLFFIEQKEGWTDLQAMQVHRYGLSEVDQGAVEYLLGLEHRLQERFRLQKFEVRATELKSSLKEVLGRLEEVARSEGWILEMSIHGSVVALRQRYAELSVAQVFKDTFNFDGPAEVQRLQLSAANAREKLGSLDSSNDGEKGLVELSQKVIDLKRARHNALSELSAQRSELEEQRRLSASIEERIRSAGDLVRLKQAGVGLLTKAECPTCRQEVSPDLFELTEQALEGVKGHLAALERQRDVARSAVTQLEAETQIASKRLELLDDERRGYEGRLSLVNSVASRSMEMVAALAGRLADAERKLDRTMRVVRNLDEIQGQVDSWISEATVELGPSTEEPVDEVTRMNAFVIDLRDFLVGLGHEGVPESEKAGVTIDSEYIPFLDGRRLRSVGSASDLARMITAYVFALLQTGSKTGGHHPGFAVLDEPLQQNPDEKHRVQFIETIGKVASALSEQVIVFTYLRQDEIPRLKAADVPLQELGGAHFLSLV